MKIREADQFLSQLHNASTQKSHYVTRSDSESHDYKVVNVKDTKQLNTAQIAEIGKECFNSYSTAELSHEKRLKVMKKLKLELKTFENRVYDSKSFFGKMGYVFGCSVSEGEQQILDVIKLAKTEVKTEKIALKQIKNLSIWYASVLENKSTSELDQAKFVYMKALEGSSFKDSQFEGFQQSSAIKSYVEDLEAYRDITDATDPKRNKIDQAITHLTSAYELAILRESSSSRGVFKKLTAPDISESDINLELQLRIQEKIENLQSEGKIGDIVLIPGGYESESAKGTGHAVLYQITKTSETTCSFTIINTGEGSEESMFSWKAVKGLVNDRAPVFDSKYENVKFEQLNKEFIQEIANPQFPDKATNKMKTLIETIDKRLEVKDAVSTVVSWFSAKSETVGDVKKTEGREHASQTTGSCTFKSVSTWVREFMGKDDYQPFKVLVTKRELAHLDQIIDKRKVTPGKQMSTKKQAEIAQIGKMLDEMKIVGQGKLATRQAKVK